MNSKYLLFGCAVILILVSCTSAPKQEAATETAAGNTVQVQPENPAPVPVPPVQAPVEPVAEEKKPAEEKKDYSAQNEALLENTEKARKAAVDAGAPALLKDEFDAAETLFSQKKEENKDLFATSDLSELLNDMTARYEALENAALAYAAKQKIDAMNLAQYDSADYEKGEKAVADIVALYSNNADGKTLLAKAKEGNEAYSRTLVTGLKKIAANARAGALSAKKQADSVYAGVSEKTAYAAAADQIAKADSNLVTGAFEAAGKGYKDAEDSFTALYKDVSEKRSAAQSAMDAAKQKVDSAAAYAVQADTTAPLGDEKVQGIESEDSVLLESDSYVNPEEAAIDVNTTEEGKQAAAIEAETAGSDETQNNAAGGNQ